MDSDGQQLEFGMMSSQRQNDYHINRYISFDGQSIHHYLYEDQQQSKKVDLPTGILSDKPYEPEDQFDQQQNNQTKCKQGLFKMRAERSKRYVQISRRTKQKYMICKKGNKRQTSLLNINFKTYLSVLLKQYCLFNQTSSYEQSKITQFNLSKPNFSSFQKLYGVQLTNLSEQQLNKQYKNDLTYSKLDEQICNKQLKKTIKMIIKPQHDNLRKYLTTQFQSGRFISRILSNRKMSYQNKLSIVKFTAQIRKSCITPQNFNNWKNSNHF